MKTNNLKRGLSLLLAMAMCLSLCACGRDYSKHQFTFLGDDFSWDMTEEEVHEYISNNQLIKNEIEVTRYDNWTVIEDDMYVFSFSVSSSSEYCSSSFRNSSLCGTFERW